MCPPADGHLCPLVFSVLKVFACAFVPTRLAFLTTLCRAVGRDDEGGSGPSLMDGMTATLQPSKYPCMDALMTSHKLFTGHANGGVCEARGSEGVD